MKRLVIGETKKLEDLEETVMIEREKMREVRYLKNRVNEYNNYLSQTDWVVIKISEAGVLDGDTDQLKEKYADVLAKRKEAREFINANE